MRAQVFPLILACAIAATATLGDASTQAASSRVVLATVVDNRNHPLVDLGADDFVVREADAPREIFAVRLADYPVVVLIDNGANARGDFETIRKAAARFVSRIGAARPVAIGTLGDPPAMLTTFDDDRGKVTRAIDGLTADASADSVLFQSVANAARVIHATGTPFSAIVIISASAIDASHNPPGDLLTPILESGAIVHVVAKRYSVRTQPGMPGRFADMLRALTDQTRGQYSAIYSAASYQAALDHLADRLSSEMMIEFIEPPRETPSLDVKVGVRIPGAHVRGLGVTPRGP
jgi:VWA domain-containing protein